MSEYVFTFLNAIGQWCKKCFETVLNLKYVSDEKTTQVYT